jgi:hypothetical protein
LKQVANVQHLHAAKWHKRLPSKVPEHSINPPREMPQREMVMPTREMSQPAPMREAAPMRESMPARETPQREMTQRDAPPE